MNTLRHHALSSNTYHHGHLINTMLRDNTDKGWPDNMVAEDMKAWWLCGGRVATWGIHTGSVALRNTVVIDCLMLLTTWMQYATLVPYVHVLVVGFLSAGLPPIHSVHYYNHALLTYPLTYWAKKRSVDMKLRRHHTHWWQHKSTRGTMVAAAGSDIFGFGRRAPASAKVPLRSCDRHRCNKTTHAKLREETQGDKGEHWCQSTGKDTTMIGKTMMTKFSITCNSRTPWVLFEVRCAKWPHGHDESIQTMSSNRQCNAQQLGKPVHSDTSGQKVRKKCQSHDKNGFLFPAIFIPVLGP